MPADRSTRHGISSANRPSRLSEWVRSRGAQTLLSVDYGDCYPPLAMSPQQQMALTLQALVDQLKGLARRQPVLFVLEDAHWIDPSTLELINSTVDSIVNESVLMVITHRPEFTAPWVWKF